MEPLFLRLSNEVRQDLHHILGLIDFAAEEPLSENQLNHLNRCREAADQLLRTTNDLAELSRPGGSAAANVSFNASFDASGAIHEVADLMGALAKRKGLSFQVAADLGRIGRVLGDKYLLQDMLRRLLDNAIQFSPSGHIRLSAVCSPALSGSAVLAIEVSDTGQGVPRDVLDDFDVDLGHARLQGLSLRILRQRLADQNGSISIVPNTPKGTTVRIALPVTFAAAGADPESPAANDSSHSPLRLLVVEDSEDSFLLFKSYIKAEGHQVTRALDGFQAIEMVKHGDYDFIVMDVNMPKMDGYAATRLIREWETEQGRTRMPILLLSADDLGRQVRLGGAAGCSGYLTKPTTKGQVVAALNYYALQPAGSPTPSALVN
jgi:CheY-like chemotaxis protein